jgi:hypothetical protein
LLPQANVFGAAAALPAAAGCVFPAKPVAPVSLIGASEALSTGAAEAPAVGVGATDAVAAADALEVAAAPAGSDFEHPVANAKPRAPAHTSRQSFIFFLSMALRLYNETKQA